MADLSSHFTFTESSATGVPGLDLPDVSPGEITLNPVAKCSACPNRATRDGGNGRHGNCFRSLSVADANKCPAHVKLIDLRNQFMRNERVMQHIRNTMGFAAGSSNLGKDDQNLENLTIYGRWAATGASGNTVTLVYREGAAGVAGSTDANPLRMIVQTFSLTSFEVSEGLLHIDTSYVRLRRGAKITFSPNCVLGFHRGMRVTGISIPVTNYTDVYDTMPITLTVDCNIAGTGLDPFPPDSTSAITADVEFYIGNYQNPQNEPMEITGFYAEAKTQDFSLPGSQVFTLESSALIANPAKAITAHLFSVTGLAGAAETDLTATALPMLVIGWDGANYSATCDMSAADLTAYDTIRFAYWIQSAATTAEYVDCLGCAHAFDDVSYGKGCRVAGDAPSGLATFNESNRCHQPNCSGFEAIDPQHPLYRQRFNDLLIEAGFCFKQYTPGIPQYYIDGCDNLSLRMLSDYPLTTPTGWHEDRIYVGGKWEATTVVDDQIVVRPGFELYWEQGQNFGPAGNNWTRETALTGHDPSELSKSQVMTSSADIHSYRASIQGAVGTFQRVESIDLVIPDITKPAPYAFPGGVMNFGFWDSRFRPVAFGDPHVVYTSMVQLAAIDVYNRMRNQVWSTNKLDVTIVDYTYDAASKTYTLDLENQVITASSRSSVQEESESSWKSSGTNVALPSHNRVQNYRCDMSTHGAQNYLLTVGDTVDFANIPEVTRFLITGARPACGSAQTWMPGSDVPEKQRVNIFALKFIDVPIAETILLVSVTRASGTVNMAGITGGQAPPIHIAKDFFYYRAVPITGSGVTRVYFKFSNANLTAAAVDSLLSLSVLTSAGTHTASGFNWYLDPVFGCNALTSYQWTLPEIAGHSTNFDEVTSVRLRYKDPATGEDAYQDFTEIAMPPTISGYGDFEYSKTVATPFSIYFQFPASVIATGEIEIQATILPDPGWTDDEYADARIATLHAASLPTALWDGQVYMEYGKLSDQIDVRDEEGVIAAWIAAGNTLVGETLQTGTKGVAHYTRPDAVSFARANDEAADVALADADYAWLGAMGRLYNKPIVTPGDCQFMAGVKILRRELMPLTNEMQSVVRTIERMLEG